MGEMEYTVTISAKEYRNLVEEHTCLDIDNRRLREDLTEESGMYCRALGELQDVRDELEKVRKELEETREALEGSRALELGYGKKAGEAE